MSEPLEISETIEAFARERIHTTGRNSWHAPSGYVYESSPWAKLERADRRFHLGIRAYCLVVTFLAAAVSLGWIELSNPTPQTAEINPSDSAVEGE